MHLVPHVAVGGTFGAGPGDPDPENSYDFKRIDSYPAVEAAVSGLMRHSSTSGPWLPGGQRLHVKTVAALKLPKKTVPSILSPKNKDSELYPNKVFTSKWIEKYTEHVPTTVIMFVELDDSVEEQLEGLRYALRAARSHILVVAVASDAADLNARLATLRRNTGLAPKTELICLRTDASKQDLQAFDESVWPLLQAQAADFFAARSRETRHKRAQNSSESDQALWEARYTLKLALFAEFKADYDGAIRLYQSAYDCLRDLDSHWMDVCVQKMVLFLLYYQRYNQAYAKFKLHIRGASEREADWLAQQYLGFAQILKHSVVEKWAVSENNPLLAVPRPGFLALTAAEHAQDEAIKQQAFELALSDLTSFPNCKATVLHAMGQHEQALRGLPANSRRFDAFATSGASNTPIGQFYRFLRGEAELPSEPLGAINRPLVRASGCFTSQTAFVGKPLQCQLTLDPLYKIPVDVTVKVLFNCASHTLEASLAKPHTFDFEIKPTETGDCEFVEIQVHCKAPEFDQRVPVHAAEHIVTETGPRHRFIVPQRSIEVHARPQLLSIDTTQIPAVLYSGEKTEISFKVLNGEDEVAEVDVRVKELYSTKISIDPHGSQELTFPLVTPVDSFSLELSTSYTTPSNGVPVAHTVQADLQVVRPFQTNFSLAPKLHNEAWPNLFVPSDQCRPLPLIRRRWMLGAKIMSMCQEPIIVVAREFVCSSAQASITALHTRVALDQALKYNESLDTDVSFEAMRKDRDLRSFEAEGDLIIEWKRKGSTHTSRYAVPKVRVSLPNQEPRVLLDINNDGNTGRIELSYFVENATSHTLNFAVSMHSSRYFSFHGPKATSVRVLPFSRHRINYCIYPVCDPINKQLPELRVFDTVYKRVLPVVSDSGSVYAENQKLFLKTFSPPL